MAEVTGAQIIAAVHAAAPEAPAVVDHTGGNCATVIVGTKDTEGRGWLSIGPGSFDWLDELQSEFYLEELSIGHDDEGQTESFYVETLDDITRYVAGEKEARS